MDRLTCKAFIVIAFMSLAVLFTANNVLAVQHRVFEYFDGLPDNYMEADWQGYNYHASVAIDDGTSLTLYGYPKTIDGQRYTCVGWADATGSITPQSGDINRVTFELRADSSITWIYKKAYEVSFDVSPMAQQVWSWGRNNSGQLGIGSFQSKTAPLGIQGTDVPWVVVAAGTDHGLAINARTTSRVLSKKFSRQGGNKYLRRLFSEGPVTQGSRLANLPTPAYATDPSFGTSY